MILNPSEERIGILSCLGLIYLFQCRLKYKRNRGFIIIGVKQITVTIVLWTMHAVGKKPVLIAEQSADRSCKSSDSPAIVFEKDAVCLLRSAL